MKQLEMLYEGKAKQVFRTDDPDKIIIHYKDAATAFSNSDCRLLPAMLRKRFRS